MSTPFLTSLRDEIAALEADLRSDPRFMKLQRLQEVLMLYSGGRAVMAQGSAIGGSAMTASATRQTPLRQPSETRLQAEKYSAEFIAGRTDPTPTREIYEMLVSRGVEVGGQQPISNLSAILSKSDQFESVGRAGWLPAIRENIDVGPTDEKFFDPACYITASDEEDEL